ncbi:MAG: MFS transporter [Chloroflexi bacterium]|nr:MFS transporter [Chloroflexota bacterium]
MAYFARIGRSTLARYLAALEYSDFRKMWLANLSAQAAAWALIVARGWLVFQKTDSSAWVGIVTFAAMGPLFFVPPFAGVLADRVNRKTILQWTYIVNLIHNLALALLALSGFLQLWHLVALSLVNGAARAVQMPTSQALAANLVPPARLLNALSLNAATLHASRLVGPGLATPLLATLGAPAAFFLCTGFYAIGLIQIMGIKTRSVGGIRVGESFVRNFVEGLSYVGGHTFIRMVIIMVLFHCGLTMAFETLLPGFAAYQLNAGATGFGTLMMAVGAGALVGSLFIGGIESPLARGRLYLLMGLLSGLGQVMLAFMPTMGAAIAAAAIMGGTQAAFMTLSQAITQTLADDEFRGRVASINTFSLGGVMSVMGLFNGFLGGQFSPAAILLVQGLLYTAIVLFSVGFATPRSVYLKGTPTEAPVPSAS